MIFVMPTIKHTGSKLTADHIFCEFNQVPIADKPVGDTIYFNHITPQTVPIFTDLLNEHPAIVPLRSPYKVAESWKKRGQPVDEMCEMWDLLITEIDPFEVSYLPVDSHERDEYLGKINIKYGLNLKTGWPVVNHHPRSVSLNNDEKEQVRLLCDNHSDFIERFYPVEGPPPGYGRNSAAD